MKTRSHSILRIAATLSLSGFTFTQAAEQFWNPSPLSNDWAGSVWSATSGGGSLTTWTASNDAVFDQAGTYTVTINAAQTATNINIKAGSVTFTGSSTVSATAITIDSGATLNTVGDRIAKSGTTQITVNGTLDLTTGGFAGGRYIQLSGSGNIIGGFRHSGTTSFSGNIQDVSSASRAAILWNGGTGGTLTLSGNNSGMTGDVLMAVASSTIIVNSANAFSSNSYLRFEGGANSNLIELAAGNFTRAWFTGSNAPGAGGINWSGTNAGFYATGGDRNLTFVTTAGGNTAANVVWGSNGLSSSTVVLGAAASTHKLTWTNNIDLNAATRTINTTNGSAAIEAEISGVLSGAAGSNLTKTGTGVLLLSNANTYNGTTTISGGTLGLGNGGTTGSLAATGTIVNNANLTINRSNAAVQGTDFSSAAITGSGSFTQAGSGTTTFTVANTYSGATNVQNGTLQLNAALASTTSLNLGNGSDSGKVVLGNAAALAQTVSGLTTVGTGTANSIVGSAVAVSALTVNLASGTNTFSGRLGGTGTNENSLSLTKSGAGILTLTSANSHSGGTTIADSQSVINPLRISHGSALGTGTLSIGSGGNDDRSRLELTGGITVANSIAALASRNNDAPNILNVSGNNTINSNISGGGGGNRTTLQSDSGKLNMAGNVSVRQLNLFGAGDGEINGSTTIAATYGLNKSGGGTWIVNNGNLNNTTATVTTGTLLVNGTLSNSSATVNGGTLGGTGTVSGAVAINTTGVLSPGASIGTFGTGALSLNTGSSFAYEMNTTAITGDRLDVNGNLSFDGTVTLNLTDLGSNSILTMGTKFTLISYFGSWDGDTFNGFADDSEFTMFNNEWVINYNDVSTGSVNGGTYANAVTLTVIPEPGTALLASLGLLALLRRRR
jgi:fibronectin-binding autotransporter adhesin